MVEYSKVDLKLTRRQLKQPKTAVENKTGTILKINLKIFDENDLPYKLLLTTRYTDNKTKSKAKKSIQ